MFKIYLKVAYRNIKKHKVYSFINISGLAVGIACSVLVMLYVCYELSYDKFHEKADQIYRIAVDAKGRGDFRIHQLGTPAILSHTLIENYPQVEYVTKLHRFKDSIVQYEESSLKENRVFAAEPSFFDIFTFPLLKGDPKSALVQPNKVVITKSAAEKYFGSEDPLFKTINIKFLQDEYQFKVTAVAKDVPANSHFSFDFVVSLETFEWSKGTNWFHNNFTTYLQLQKGTTKEPMEEDLAEILDKYAFAGRQHNWRWSLEPLTDIHLQSDLSTGIEPNVNATYVYIFTIIAFFILFIACINFMNLSTARSAKRAKEVGIRKVVGSRKFQLVKQFLGESILMSFASLFLALMFIEIILPFYRNLTGKNLSLPYFDNPFIIPGLIGLTLMVGIISGIYPAFFLSFFRPVNVLKGSTLSGKTKGSSILRNGLVIFQFSMSVLLLVGTIIIYNQMEYIRNKRLGFDKDHVIVIHNSNILDKQTEIFKEQLQQYSGIRDVSGCAYLPGEGFSNLGIELADIDRTSLNLTLDMNSCDYNFLNTLKMKMSEGRFFSSDFLTDTSAIVINEEAVRYFGLTEPIGKYIRIHYPGKNLKIIGVIKDFHFESLHLEIKRMGLVLPGSLPFWFDEKYIFARVYSENMFETLAYMKKTWNSLSSVLPFEYSFLDEKLDNLYNQEITTGKIVALFSILAILISCLGLFGLAAFVTEQRTKEVGIRKVFGASLSNILQILTKEFIVLVTIANMIAWPIAYFAMNRWLQNFAYRINIGWWTFALAGALALVIALVTVSYQAIKAAVTNPIEALRYE